jgi:hypothetical protein
VWSPELLNYAILQGSCMKRNILPLRCFHTSMGGGDWYKFQEHQGTNIAIIYAWLGVIFFLFFF